MEQKHTEDKTLPQDDNVDRDRWIESLEFVIESVMRDRESSQVPILLERLVSRLRDSGIPIPSSVSSPYVNTIPADAEPPYPGDRDIERRIKSYIRWNAMAMVVKANRAHSGLGGHISTYASSATLYEVAFNHFFRGGDDGRLADMVYFQGHGVPGDLCARVPRRAARRPNISIISARNSAEGGGLSSYPHPYLMPDFWQFPTVSMGLGPIQSIYQARFNRYLRARGLASGTRSRGSGAFLGDGEIG